MWENHDGQSSIRRHLTASGVRLVIMELELPSLSPGELLVSTHLPYIQTLGRALLHSETHPYQSAVKEH